MIVVFSSPPPLPELKVDGGPVDLLQEEAVPGAQHVARLEYGPV